MRNGGEKLPDCLVNILAPPHPALFDQMLEISRIEGRNWSLEAIHTPGHMSNHLCFTLAEEKALFAGDHVMAWSTSVVAPPDGNMGQ